MLTAQGLVGPGEGPLVPLPVTDRLAPHLDRLAALGVGYRPPAA